MFSIFCKIYENIGKIIVMSNIILTIEDNTNIMIMNCDYITKDRINTVNHV